MNKNTNTLKPIQLISFDENKNLKLSTDAAEIITGMNASQIYVVIVAGKYRTGKSYILNRVLLNKNSGFQVGPTINACTKGLWMWPQLVQIADSSGRIKKCIIIDTEGLGSLEEGQNTDIKIFLMAILLSSYLIYNSVGSIDEKALESLSLVINLAEMLHKENNEYDAQELINCFPSFMWLIRDFSLRLQDEDGEPISCSQYLQMALRQQKSSKGISRKNIIRKKLKTFFHDRNCFTLIRPTENQKDLQNLSKISEQRLRPEFIKLIKQFKSVIYEELRPKRVKGKCVTSQGFIELCKYFIEMINSGKLPSISSHWENICMRQSARIMQKYCENHYNTLIESIHSENTEMSIQQKMDTVQLTHNSIKSEAFTKIDKSFLGKLEKQLSRERIEKKLNKIYEDVVEKINQQRFSKVKEIIQEIFLQIMVEFSSNKLESFEQIFARFQEIKQKYKHDARIYKSFYENSKDVFQEFLRNLKNQWQKEQELMKEKNGHLETVIESKTVEMKENAIKFDDLVREAQKTSYKYQLQLNQKNKDINHLKNQLNKLSKQNQELIAKTQQLKDDNKKHQYQELEKAKQKSLQEIAELHQENKELTIELAKMTQSYKDSQIKERKNLREMEIFKNKCSEYFKQNINLTEEIQFLKKKILDSEKQSRKSSMLSKSRVQMNSDVPEFIQSLNNQIDKLEMDLSIKEEALRSTNQLLTDERATNQTLLKAPQNMNYQILKKNYDMQCKSSHKLSQKLKEYESMLILCDLKCLICKKQYMDRKMIKEHLENCKQTKDVDFDVSYEYNGNGEIQFVIDVVVNNYERSWSIRKTIKNIRLFLKKMEKVYLSIAENNRLFQKNAGDSELEDQEDLIEQRRAYLNQLFNDYREEIWSNSFMIEFYGIDIHYLNEKIINIPSLHKPISMKSSKVSSELSIDLSDLGDENCDPSFLNTEHENLLMKTCKFSKKTFNFGPEM